MHFSLFFPRTLSSMARLHVIFSFCVWTFLCFLTQFTIGSILPAFIHSLLLIVDPEMESPLLLFESETTNREEEDTCSESSSWDED